MAIYSCNTAPTVTIQANGGPSGSGQAGGAGVLTTGSNSIDFVVQPDAFVQAIESLDLALIVDAIGDGPLSYQWRKDGVDLTDDGRITGSNDAVLQISTVEFGDAGVYDVVVGDACGEILSKSSFVSVAPRPSCNDGDLAPPFGVLDLADVDAFVLSFVSGTDAADLVDPFGVLDLNDIDAFVVSFLGGCP